MEIAENVALQADGTTKILDQSALPNVIQYRTLQTPEDFYDAIYKLEVRGAPAIGCCAGFGIDRKSVV